MTYKIEDIREVHFYRNGSEVSPSLVVKESYCPLEKLVRKNREHNHSNHALQGYGEDGLYKEVLQNIRDAPLFSARVIFDNGKRREFDVKPRTNFDKGTRKTPNIVYLEDESAEQLIFREARIYEEDKFIQKAIKSVFGKHYIDLLSSELAERELVVPSNGVVSLPEPFLIPALERIYEDRRIRRITPHLKVVEASKNKLWYVRNFLPSVRDTHLNDGAFFGFIGIFNGLGLIDKLDGQVTHYCVNSGRAIVNIDPDFITYSPSMKIIDGFDWQDFKDVRTRELDVHNHFGKDVNKRRRNVIRETQKTMGGKTILDYVKADVIKDEVISRLGVDNLIAQGH